MNHSATDAAEVEAIELDLFVTAMQRRHGYDFSRYARASLLRRVRQLARDQGGGTIGTLTHRLLHEPVLLPRLLAGLSVPASDMFRDPSVFRALRERIVPLLAAFPHIRPGAHAARRCTRWQSCWRRPGCTSAARSSPPT